jgi:hypothetical protein
VTEFRHQCHVIISLSAVHQCFSLEVELGDIAVFRKTVSGTGFSEERSFAVAGA